MKPRLLTGLLAGAMLLSLSVPLGWAEGGYGNTHTGYSKGPTSRYGTGHGYSRGYGMGGSHRGTGHLIRGLLAGAEEMGLTDDQVKKLKDIQLNLDKTRIHAEADIQVAEREARALMDDETADLSAVESTLKNSADKQVSLRIAAFQARKDAIAVLTPEQSKRVKQFHDMMRKHSKETMKGHGKQPHGDDD